MNSTMSKIEALLSDLQGISTSLDPVQLELKSRD